MLPRPQQPRRRLRRPGQRRRHRRGRAQFPRAADACCGTTRHARQPLAPDPARGRADQPRRRRRPGQRGRPATWSRSTRSTAAAATRATSARACTSAWGSATRRPDRGPLDRRAAGGHRDASRGSLLTIVEGRGAVPVALSADSAAGRQIACRRRRGERAAGQVARYRGGVICVIACSAPACDGAWPAACWSGGVVTAADRGLPPSGSATSPASRRIAFQHTDGSSGRRYIVETVSRRLATFDYDGDGRSTSTSSTARRCRAPKRDAPPRNALYRNRRLAVPRRDRAGRRRRHRLRAGRDRRRLRQRRIPDLYLNNYRPERAVPQQRRRHVHRRDRGRPAWRDGDHVGAGACFLDIDGDGDLDLYVANYVEFTYDDTRRPDRRRLSRLPGPQDYPPEPDTLYRNNGDGTFTDISRESGIGAHAGHRHGHGLRRLRPRRRHRHLRAERRGRRTSSSATTGTGRFEEVAAGSGIAYNWTGTNWAPWASTAATTTTTAGWTST